MVKIPNIFKRSICFLLTLGLGLPCFAENKSEYDALDAIDGWDNFKSAVTTDGKYFLIGGAALTGALLLTRDNFSDQFQSDLANSKPLGSTSHFGDLMGKQVPNFIYAGAMATTGFLHNDNEAIRDASGMMYATVYAGLTTTVLKKMVKEERPNKSNVHDSFPSAHTASAFAFASYVGCRHSLPWGIAAYTMATFVGVSRMNDNAHYLHDVTAGAAIGGAFGLGVCQAENKRVEAITKPKTNVQSSWYVIPNDGGLAGGIGISY